MDKQQKKETSFLVLNKKEDWDRGMSYNIELSGEGIKLKEVTGYSAESTFNLQKDAGVKDILSFTVGECGTLYILQSQPPFFTLYDFINKRTEVIPCLEEIFKNPKEPVDMAFSENTLYIAYTREFGDITERKVVGFNIFHWQTILEVKASPDLTMDHFDGLKFSPSAIATDGKRNLYVLDAGNSAVVKIDLSSSIRRVYELGASIDTSEKNTWMTTKDEYVFILDQKNKGIFRLSLLDGVIQRIVDLELLVPGIIPSGLAADEKGNLLVGDLREKASNGEDNRFIYEIKSPEFNFVERLQGYRGGVDKMITTNKGSLYVLNKEKQEISVLKKNKRNKGFGEEGLPFGVFLSRAFDSTLQGNQWHKFTVDADIPDNTQIKLFTLASDEKRVSVDGNIRDLDSFILDEGVTLEKKLGLHWSGPYINARDALMKENKGRYLWIRIELMGDELNSPFVKNVKFYFPGISYLRYLPAVYQEDEQSKDFLERFLAIFESLFMDMEYTIDHIVRYFDPDVVSSGFLRWLSKWLAITAGDLFPEEKLRLLVKRAPHLYKKRGTRECIEEMLEIYTGRKPFIIEHFQLRCARNLPEDLRELLLRLYGTNPYRFCVLLRPDQVKSTEDVSIIRRIVELEKPAHTLGGVVALQPWIYLDTHTYLGVNSYLSKPLPVLDTGSVIGRDTVLTDVDKTGQLERNSNLDMNAVLA